MNGACYYITASGANENISIKDCLVLTEKYFDVNECQTEGNFYMEACLPEESDTDVKTSTQYEQQKSDTPGKSTYGTCTRQTGSSLNYNYVESLQNLGQDAKLQHNCSGDGSPDHTPNKQYKADLPSKTSIVNSQQSIDWECLDSGSVHNIPSVSVNNIPSCSVHNIPTQSKPSHVYTTSCECYNNFQSAVQYTTKLVASHQQKLPNDHILDNPCQWNTTWPPRQYQSAARYLPPVICLPQNLDTQTQSGTQKEDLGVRDQQQLVSTQQTGTQHDILLDQGYFSHSTESSCQGQDSQKEGSVMEQESQVDLNIPPMSDGAMEWPTHASCDETYLHGENELEDLLYHFQNFFRNRFESELQNFQESVYGIMEEQQSHVRQIVHTAMREQSSQNSAADLLFDNEINEVQKQSTNSDARKRSLADMASGIEDLSFHVQTSTPSCTIQSTDAGDDTEKKQILLELMTLSCSISTLLTKPQYRT